MFYMQKNLLTLLSVLTFILFSTIGSAQGTFDVRFLIDSIDCVNEKLFVDIQVRADNPGQEYLLGDQNYRFSFDRGVLANPQIVQELEVSGLINGGAGPLGYSIYSPHTLTGSLDTIVSYNLELQGGDGLFTADATYFNVGRLSFDILDFNLPIYLRWHRDIPADFPNTFVGQKLNGSLIPTDEGSYLDYNQDLSSACNNITPVAVNDAGTTPEEQPITVCLTTNDSDPENALDNTSVTLLSTPPAAEGTVTIDALTGCITFTPAAGFFGTVTPFGYKICDLGVLIPSYQGDNNPLPIPLPNPDNPPLQTQPPACTSATINLTVTNVNDAPTAANDTETTTEDTPLNSDVTSNDSDIDGDNLIVNTTAVTPPANGTVVINSNGTYTYTPNADFNGSDSFVYEVCDDGSPSLCANATVNINIIPVNDAPIAVDDSEIANEDALLNSDVTLNDSDLEGDNLIVNTIAVTPPTNGALVLNTNGTYTYTPNPDFNGTDTFQYQVCDDGTPSECATATVTILVAPINDAPIAVDDTETTAEDIPLNSNVTPNDSDIDGDNLIVNTTAVTPPANGTVVINSNGTYTYTPDPNFNGSDSFVYEVCDDDPVRLCAQATVNITVTPVNDAPVAADDTETTTEDTPLNSDVTPNDSDIDGNNLIVNTTAVTPPANGIVTLNADGTYIYTPNTDFNGTDSFEYTICDNSSPALCDNAVVTITVTPVNDTPLAVDDSNTTIEDTPVSGDVIPNDSDPDGDNLAVNTTPTADPMNGTVALNADGTYTYTPNLDFNGTDSFQYEVCDDGTPQLCARATVTITLTPVNDAPVAVDDFGTTPEDIPFNGQTVLSNDTDVDTGDTLSVNTTPISTPANGTVMINPDGTFLYTPNAGFNGSDTFEYQVCDDGTPQLCDIGMVTVTIDNVNDQPTALDDVATTPEDTPLNGTSVLGNDTDIDGNNLTINTTPITDVTNGALTINPDGTYLYTPNLDFNGTDSFQYEICDDGINPANLCDTATVVITITPVNDTPVAVDDSGTTAEDVPLTGTTILTNDSDVDTGDILTATATSTTPPANGTVIINLDGTYTYTPNQDFTGTDSFVYEVCDNGTPIQCTTATVTITVTPLNDAPVAIDDAETTAEDTPINSTVIMNDSDVDGDNIIVNITPVTDVTNGTLTLNADGTYTYAPNADFFGTDSFEYEICDDGTPQECATAIVNITIESVNDAPIALDDMEMTPEDTPISSDVTPNDSDVDVADNLTVNTAPVTAPANGGVTLNGDGTYTYTPDPGFFGTDSFMYEICDDGTPVECAQATVTIDVTSVNDIPVAADDAETTPEDTPVSLDVLTNDSDADTADNLTVTTIPVTPPTNGTVALTPGGIATYTPNLDFFGTDTFEYEVCDDGSPILCDVATVTITVTPVNDAPVAVDDAETTEENIPLNSDVSPNDSDVDSDSLTVASTPTTDVTNGTLVLNFDGTYTYTPNTNYNGLDMFEYEICDNDSPVLCDTATVTISIGPVNDPPIAIDDTATTTEDTPLNGTSVLGNDSDIDTGDVLTVNTTPIVDVANGTLVINLDGTYLYTPNPNFFGTDTFDYEVCDNGDPIICSTATVTITVTSVNDQPIAVDDTAATPEDTPVTSDVIPNDSDADTADVLAVTGTPVTLPANGTVTLSASGAYTYTPNPGFFGTDTFEYEVCDNGTPVLCDVATVTITVTSVNDQPVAVDDAETTTEDVPISSDVTPNDSDVDVADNLTVTTTPITAPANGTLALNPDGTYVYTPNANYFGTDSFEYEICDDGSPVLCDIALVDISISSVNDAPVALDDSETTTENTPISSTVTPNDTDVDVADTLTVNTTPITPPANGILILNADGTYTYTPNTNYNGLDSFEYEICDNGTPQLCDTAIVTIGVGAVNDPPTAVNDSEITLEDVAINSDVTLNDSDLDGDSLIVTTTSVVAPMNGTLVLNTDGTYTYTPNPNYFGTDSFTYQICDDGVPVLCSTAVVDITITSVNDVPVAVNDAETTLEDVPVSSDVTPNDSDADVADVLTVNTTPITDVTNGTLVLNSDGTYNYTPNSSFFGTDSFVYEICDNGTPVECATATVIITIESDNDAPVAVDDAETTPEDTPLSSDVTLNDSDLDGDNLIVNTAPVADVSNGTLVLNADGTFTYTPNADFNGTDSFEYEVCDDGIPSLCTTATVTIDVTPVNDAPIAEDDTETTLEDTPLTSDVSPNDSDIETAAMTYTTVTGPANGNLVLNSDGTYIYTPLPSFFGTDMFTYEACDGGTPVLCDEATVFITIEPDNDAPIAKNDIGNTNEDTPLSSTLAANDSEPDGENLIYTATPVNGPSDGTVVINPDGTYTYTPDLNFNGFDNFTYEVCDDGVPQLCSEAVATIRVNAINDAPDLGDDAVVTDELVPVDIDVVANDSDVEDGAIDPCSVAIITPPLGGTVTFGPAPACVMTYTPNPGFSGIDAFEYEVCDANGSCSTAIVDVTVGATCLDVQLSVWLEGGLTNLSNGYMPTMRTTLSDTRMLLPGQSNSSLPAGQPYNVAPWNYPGIEGAGWTDADYASVALTKGAGIVDWVVVSFRTDVASNTTFQRAAALVFEDGSVVFPEPCVLTVSAPSSFYIVIEHRNHMGAMSHVPVSANGGQINYDFRTQDSWVNGTSFGQIEVEPGKYAMYAGDSEKIPDAFSYDINAVDKTSWLAENGVFGQYLYNDFNLNGDTNGGDKIIWTRNNGIASGVPK